MKHKLLSVFALAVGLLLSGCAVEEVPVAEHTILAVMEGDHTRTSVTDEGAFSWSTGDQVWLETTNGSVPGTLSSGAGTSRASFSTGVFIGDLTGKAVYPYNAGHSISGDELSFVLPASYDLGSNLTNTNVAMYGVDVDGTIRFNHLAGVMRFVFKNVPAGTDKFQITLDKKISGVFTADLTEALPIIETSAASSQSDKTVTLNFDALKSVSDISLYVPLPVGTYTTLGLELWAGDKSLWSYSNTVTNKINRKTLKLMPAVNMGTSVDGDIEGGVVDLSENGTANSYIVSAAGSYKFTTVKGNSSESVGAVSSAEVLWETFGTDVTPNVGDLVKNVKYADGGISFDTPSAFKEGNAVIAAKDASGNILWSWHIWLTDQPQGQEYYNNAGTMMDRNLGAISATPGDVGTLGLLYQWGRKDPFLGSSSISSTIEAKSTVTWPSAVSSDSSNGTIAYATANPTTFITGNDSNYDWYYTGSESTDNTRWATSETTKSIYDPCPAGWRVPDGGDNGIWSKALGSSSYFTQSSLYDRTNQGLNFSGKLGSANTIWYPASGYRHYYDGSLDGVGGFSCGYCWSASPLSYRAFGLYFYYIGDVNPSSYNNRVDGHSVRCVREGSAPSEPMEPDAVNLSDEGTANSYIVSESGIYKFSTVKGNSSESVGAVASAEVLWETFGTDVTPNVGDLVKNAVYSDGYITFQTADTFKEGNAVIAAKDASGNILWSWHIWFTDEPQGQEYYNNAGTMMDRNLGATSATPGDLGALGLLYQWGRKDPFLGSSSISSSSALSKSTITWPEAVLSRSNGTIEYAIAHPTTFITYNNKNNDWYYTGTSSTDNTRWTEYDMTKSKYDPCPLGWRVPEGGFYGVWSNALGSYSDFSKNFDTVNEGMDFSNKFGAAQTIWYPASGYLSYGGGNLDDVGQYGLYWSASPSADRAVTFTFNNRDYVYPAMSYRYRALAHSVRCVQE